MERDDLEDDELRSVAQQNAQAIFRARQRAEEQLFDAKEALEARTLELSRSLSLMHATLEATADGILVTDVEGRIVTFNNRFLQIWGLPREAVEGAVHATLAALVGHLFADPASLGERIDHIHATPSVESLDLLELADGRAFERYSRPQVVAGCIVGRVWSYRDITDRRRAEEVVRDEARVLDMLNRTGAAIAGTLDLQSVLQTVTDSATALSGAEVGAFFYNPTDGEKAFMLHTLSGAHRGAFERFGYPRATPLFGPTFNGQASVRCADVTEDPRYGRWAPHHGMPKGHFPVRSYLAVPVAGGDSGAIGGLFFGHSRPDVFSDRAQRIVEGIAAQASVAIVNARLYKEIQRASRLKDDFLATLSHELRTPLSAILGWASVLLRRNGDTEVLERGLHAIERNAAAQARLIEDLLDMNSIVSGKVRLERQMVDMTRVVDAAVDAVRPGADAKGIRLRTSGGRGGEDLVSGDPDRLQQVVRNLLTNAVKYTPNDGAVHVALRRAGSELELSVSDTGIGIDTSFLPHVFDRFRQADASTTRSQGGLGLGLSIVKQLVELHGGTVRLTSAGAQEGTTCCVRLPLAADDASSATPEREPPPPCPAASPPLIGLKVLVVDDDPDVCELIRQQLEDAHADVRTACSAEGALASVCRDRPDLLLSDIGMPGRDGYQLLRDIRGLSTDQGGAMPAIALTAFTGPEDGDRARAAGFQVHLAKPIAPEALVAAVAALAARHRAV